MKNLFLFLGVNFCLLMYSLPLYAMENKNTEITLIIGGDTIISEKSIFDTYGREKVIQAYYESGLVVKTLSLCDWSPLKCKKQKKTIIVSLIKKENKVVESKSLPIIEDCSTNWLIVTIIIIIFFIVGLCLYYLNKYIFAKHIYLEYIFVGLVVILHLFIYIFIVNTLWFILIISVVSFGLGFFLSYIYVLKKKERKNNKNISTKKNKKK